MKKESQLLRVDETVIKMYPKIGRAAGDLVCIGRCATGKMEHLISLREPLKKAERSLFSSAKLGCANGFLCCSHFLGYILVTLLSTLS